MPIFGVPHERSLMDKRGDGILLPNVCFLYWSLSCLQGIQILFVKVKKLSLKNSSNVFEDNFFFTETFGRNLHLIKLLIKDAYLKVLKFICQHHVQ